MRSVAVIKYQCGSVVAPQRRHTIAQQMLVGIVGGHFDVEERCRREGWRRDDRTSRYRCGRAVLAERHHVSVEAAVVNQHRHTVSRSERTSAVSKGSARFLE